MSDKSQGRKEMRMMNATQPNKELTVLQKWGNSSGVRIPASFKKILGIENGTILDLELVNNTIVIRKARKKQTLDDLLQKYDPEKEHKELNWGNPEGDEMW
ncbi:AbrB/MazE/SpoVT family DNA-binding domain-containing protein [Alkalihalobacillus sp. FSL W8-0930]